MNATRTRMIEAAVEALRRRGVAGMSFTEVIEDAGAARGAIYHHFPGGKNQLIAEATDRNGQDVRANLGELPSENPRTVVAAFLDLVRPVVEQSAHGSGCAVAAAALGPDPAGDGEALRTVANEAFTSWTATLTASLTAAGAPEPEAADLATMLIVLLEGAHVLCRAAGDLAPFEQASAAAAALVESRYPEV